MNVFPRSEAAVSYVPGHPPRASAKAIAGGSSSTTVVPVRRRRSCAWPTRTPRIAVSVPFDAVAPLPESRRRSEFYLTDVRRDADRDRSYLYVEVCPMGPISNGEVFDVELHTAVLEFGQEVLRRKLLRGQDSRSRGALRQDHDDARRRGRRGQESFRGRPSSPVRFPMLHREGCPYGTLRSVRLRAVDLHDDREGAAHGTDERRRFGDRREERLPEWDVDRPDLHRVVWIQQAQGMERVDRLHELRPDVVLVVDPADRFSHVLGQGEDLLMSEEVDVPLPDRRGECIVLFAAHWLPLDETGPVPDDGRGEGVVQKDLPRVERETVRLLLSRRRLPHEDPIDRRESLRSDAGHHVREARVRSHGDDCGEAALPPRRVPAELVEDVSLLAGRPGAVPGRVDVGASDLEAGLHDPDVVLRQRRIHRDVRIGEDATEGVRILHVGLEGLNGRRLAEGFQGPRTVSPLVRDHDLLDTRVRRQLEGDDPPESAGPQDHRLHVASKRGATLRSFDLIFFG